MADNNNKTAETSFDLSFEMHPTFEIQGAHAANFDLSSTDNAPQSSNHLCRSPSPLPLLSDQFTEEQGKVKTNSSYSDDNFWKTETKQSSSSIKSCIQEISPTLPKDFSLCPETSDSDKVLNSFPQCGAEELLDFFNLCQGNVDDTTSMLLDSGYAMTGDPYVRRNLKSITLDETERSKESLLDNPKPIASRLSHSRSQSLTTGSSLNICKNKSFSPASASNCKHLESSAKESTKDTKTSGDYSLIPFDGEDWVDFELSPRIVQSISDLYGGDVHGKNPSELTQEERKIRIPPEMAFELYRYLVLNVSRIQQEKSEADGIAAEDILQEQCGTDTVGINICEEEEDDELKEILLQIQKMENDATANSEPQSFSILMSADASKASVEAMRMEKLKMVKRTAAQNINFAQLKLAFPSLKPNLVEELFLQSGFNYEKALTTLKELYQSKFVDNSNKRIEEPPPVCSSQFPQGEELKYDPEVVARMSATERREMTEASERWKLQCRDYAENYEEYKDNAKKHRGHPETCSYFMLKAAEVKSLLKQAQKEEAFYTVISRNAGNNNPNEIDLHGLPFQYAIEIVAKYLNNRTAWVRNNIGPGTPVNVTIITGIGKHSYNNIPKINPAVRNYLRSNHYSYNDQGGSFLVRLTNNKKTSTK